MALACASDPEHNVSVVPPILARARAERGALRIRARIRSGGLAAFAAAVPLFGVFVLYRAYRGFFVILPAVFTEVRNKLEDEQIESPFVSNDVNPATGKLKLRSSILMNIGAGAFTVFLMLRLLVKGVFFGVRGAALGVLRLCGRKKPEPEQPPAVPDAAATPVTDAAPDADAESLAEFLAE